MVASGDSKGVSKIAPWFQLHLVCHEVSMMFSCKCKRKKCFNVIGGFWCNGLCAAFLCRCFESRVFQEQDDNIHVQRSPSWLTLSFGWDETKQCVKKPHHGLSKADLEIDPAQAPAVTPGWKFVCL